MAFALRYLRTNGKIVDSARGEVSNHERNPAKSEFPQFKQQHRTRPPVAPRELLKMAIPPLTLSIGSAEHAMRSLLERELAREHLLFSHWTVLVCVTAAPLPPQKIVQQQLASHVVTSAAETQEAIADLVAAGILTRNADGSLQHSTQGHALFVTVSRSVEGVKNALYADLPLVDLEAAHRVLLEMAARANKLLARGSVQPPAAADNSLTPRFHSGVR